MALSSGHFPVSTLSLGDAITRLGVLSTETRQASVTSQLSHETGAGWSYIIAVERNYMGCNPDQKGRSGCKAYGPISGIVQLFGDGEVPLPC